MKIGKYGNVFLLCLIWGTLYAAQGYANKNVSTYTTGVATFVITISLLTLTMLARGTFKEIFTVKKLFPRLLMIGIIGFSINFTNFIGFKYGSAQTGAFLLKTDVLMVNIVSVLLYKELFTKKDWFYSLAMFAGVLMIIGVDFTKMTFQIGDMMFIVSAILLTWNTFNIKNVLVQKDTPISQMSVAFYNVLITMTLFTTMLFATGAAGELVTAFTVPAIAIALVVSGLMQYSLFISYYKALADLPAWIVKVILLLIPIVTLILTYFIYGTLPTTLALAGCGVVLLSAYGIIREQTIKSKLQTAAK